MATSATWNVEPRAVRTEFGFEEVHISLGPLRRHGVTPKVVGDAVEEILEPVGTHRQSTRNRPGGAANKVWVSTRWSAAEPNKLRDSEHAMDLLHFEEALNARPQDENPQRAVPLSLQNQTVC